MDLNNNVTKSVIEYYPLQSSLTQDQQGGWVRRFVSGADSYYGFANLGASPDAAVWKIRKETLTAGETVVRYADGNLNFDNIWTDRASLTYI